MITFLLTALLVSVAINVAMFLVAYKLQSDKLTDVSYAFTFLTLAVFGFVQSDQSAIHTVLLAMVALWAIRIGSFLLYRVSVVGKDQRFDGMRENFMQFGKFWLVQAVTVWVLMVPSLLAFKVGAAFNTVVIAGIVLWAIGLGVEAVADFQKFRFSRDSKNKNTWIETGVWKYSRHPNYFGEILVWIGVYCFVVTSLSPVQAVVGLVSPLFITMLLLFFSGVPILEKSADARWGDLKQYRAYKNRTSILIPLPNKKRS